MSYTILLHNYLTVTQSDCVTKTKLCNRVTQFLKLCNSFFWVQHQKFWMKLFWICNKKFVSNIRSFQCSAFLQMLQLYAIAWNWIQLNCNSVQMHAIAATLLLSLVSLNSHQKICINRISFQYFSFQCHKINPQKSFSVCFFIYFLN